ncbi:MAG: L-arabinonolactonase [Acidimicrobiales bacterium]|jgi:L-arabinonolactonase
MTNIDVVVSQPAQLGEGPLWSVAEQVLYWVDIDGHAVHRYDPSTGVDEQKATPGRPGSLALTSDPGKLVLSSEHEVLWFDWANGATQPFVSLESPGAGIRMNDGRTDPAGRFIVGTMFQDSGAGQFVGSLHRIDANGNSTALRRAVGTANGLAFDTDRDIMYWADTPTQQVLAWDYDASTGDRSNERVFFDYQTVEGKPDGACVDVDGHYWSASVRGWALTRVAPDGSVERRIELPVELPTMPCFGGPNLDMLFITSINTGSDDAASVARRRGVAAGSLLAIDMSGEGIQGRPDALFAGTHP